MKSSSHIFRAVRMIIAASGNSIWKSIVLTVFQGVLPLLFIYLIKMVVDAVSKAGIDADAQSSYSLYFVFTLLFACFLAYFLNVAIGSYASVVREDLSGRVGRKMYALLHEKSTSLDMTFFEDPAYHDLFHRASRDITYRPNRITASLLQLLQNSVSLTLLAFLLIYIHWAVAVVLFLAAIPSMIVRVKHSRDYFRWNQKNIRTERFMNYFHRILTGEAFAKEIRLFGLAPYFTGRFDENHSNLRTSRLAMSRRRMWGEILAQLFASIAVFGSLAFIIRAAVHGNISIGSVVLYFLAFQRGLSFLREATASLGNLYEDRLFLEDLYTFLGLETRKNTSGKAEVVSDSVSVTLKNVSFTYPGSGSNAIKNLSITLEAGKHYALVGENGAGKSTLVKLLCGLYQPQDGELRLNGVNYEDIPQEKLLKNFSALFQDFVLYYLTAGENIRFGDIDKPQSREALDTAAAEAGVDELLLTFSQGWDTSLGRIMDGGRQLSMGEWQKIALARAFYRNAPILLLDEPGSAVDARAEAAFIAKFHKLTAGKTTLIISHRLSAVRNTDKILVLDKGILTETGTHDELIKLNGKYAELFNLQASSYL